MSPVIWMLECRSIDDTALMSAPPAILVTSSVPIRRIHQLDEETELVAPSLMPLGAKHVYMAPCGLPDPVYPTVLGLTVIEVTGMSDFGTDGPAGRAQMEHRVNPFTLESPFGAPSGIQ
jgi:hypothetical protein